MYQKGQKKEKSPHDEALSPDEDEDEDVGDADTTLLTLLNSIKNTNLVFTSAQPTFNFSSNLRSPRSLIQIRSIPSKARSTMICRAATQTNHFNQAHRPVRRR